MNNNQIVSLAIQGYSMLQIADLCNVAVEEVEDVCYSDEDFLSIEFGFSPIAMGARQWNSVGA